MSTGNHSGKRVAIVDGLRTPFGKAGGSLREVQADDLAVQVVKEVLARTGVEPGDLDEVVFGNVAQPAHAANIARIIALKAGVPNHVPCQTVHRNCASGMQAITTGATQILAGRSDLVLAGGTESMSNIPLLVGRQMTDLLGALMRAKTLDKKLKLWMRFRPSFLAPVIGIKLGLTDVVCGLNMGQTAEVLAREFGVTRAEQDEFALVSHQRASKAAADGVLGEEILPMPVPPKYEQVRSSDEGPRAEQSIEALAKLRPFFDRYAGTVTVGNACPVTDGAGAVLLASEERAQAEGWEVLGYLSEWSYAGLEGSRMGLGPVYATAKLLEKTGGTMDEYELVELNEAFAAQVIANERAFASDVFAREHLGRDKAVGEIDREKLNVNGGAIALGHPVGATGTRLVITTLKEMKRRGVGKGLATLCIGGGQGAALSLEAA